MISTFRKVWIPTPIQFPAFSNTRVLMMPLILGNLDGVPEHYKPLVEQLYLSVEQRFIGSVGYLTIDEQDLLPGETLRRSGYHVDGYYLGRCGAWGGGGPWGSVGNGMLTVSSTSHCRAYLGVVKGEPGPQGEADHLLTQTEEKNFITFDSNQIYWVDGACIHTSLPVEKATQRQFVRLSMPSNGPWFENYTPNPTGVKPSNETLSSRRTQLVDTLPFKLIDFNPDTKYGVAGKDLLDPKDIIKVLSDIFQLTGEDSIKLNVKSINNNLITTLEVDIDRDFLDNHYIHSSDPEYWVVSECNKYPEFIKG